MIMLTLFHWLAKTSLAIALRDSTWAFAIIEVIHLLTLAIFGGAVLMVDLRLLGIGLKTQSRSQVSRELFPIVLIGLGVMLVSGFLLLASGPMRYYYNPAFRIKLVLFTVATIFQIALQQRAGRAEEQQVRGFYIGAVVSLLLWLSIGLAGRAIGYV